MNAMTTKEAAKLWGISERRVAFLCKEGKITGAYKQGKNWLIPTYTPKPTDHRFKKRDNDIAKPVSKLPLPIGISDYRLASTQYYYIDKTMLIKDFIDERPIVSLFTRPRRFGKTLTMDMLRTFFEKTEEDTSIYFKNKKIWQCGKYYQQYQGKYPVIFITFKDVKKESWQETLEHIKQIIKSEYKRHHELATSSKIMDLDYYQQIINDEVNDGAYDSSLFMLSKMLHEHYGIAPIVIIDEYDIPIQQGYMQGFYNQVILFMRNTFSGVFKDNKHLSYGFLTGILRVAKESIFSGLNNIKINSILDERYSEYFGFTSDEILEMTKYYEVEDKFNEICEWYDGYRFGDTDIFNPWSVINYFNSHFSPRAFWQSTGSNDIISEVITYANADILDKLTRLMKGESFPTFIDTGVIYPQIKNNPSTIYSFLLVAGYLKANKTTLSITGDFICEVSLPNKEIAYVYNKEILQSLDQLLPLSKTAIIQEALYSNDVYTFQQLISELLLHSISFYDTLGENFYHGLMLGICAMLSDTYVTSNKEAGDGRYDIQLMPKKPHLPGILIELKASKNNEEQHLQKLAQEALDQINHKNYDAELKQKGVQTIYKYGIAFSGKKVQMVTENTEKTHVL